MIAESSDPSVVRELVGYVVEGKTISVNAVDQLTTDLGLWRRALRACMHSKGYNTPESLDRFEEVAYELKMLTTSAAKAEKESEIELRNAARSEQAIAFRAILKQRGRCGDFTIAYSSDVKDAKSMREDNCWPCSVREACAEYAIVFNENFGMWGGLSERARARTKRRIKESIGEDKFNRSHLLPPEHETRVDIRSKILDSLKEEDDRVIKKKATKAAPKI